MKVLIELEQGDYNHLVCWEDTSAHTPHQLASPPGSAAWHCMKNIMLETKHCILVMSSFDRGVNAAD